MKIYSELNFLTEQKLTDQIKVTYKNNRIPSIKRKNIKKQIEQLLNNNPDNTTNNHIPTDKTDQTNMTATIDNTTTTITQNRNILHKNMAMNINDDFYNPQLINRATSIARYARLPQKNRKYLHRNTYYQV